MERHNDLRGLRTPRTLSSIPILSALLIVLLVTAGLRHTAGASAAFGASSVTISAECGDAGMVGTISGVPGPYPVSFDVFVTDHIPGESVFVEIPGSRVSVTATSSSVSYGPLDTSQHRDGVNTMRVETTLNNEKSRILLCLTSPTPTSTPTSAPPTHTPTGAASSTPATGTPIATGTSAPTGVATGATGAGANPSSVPTLVNTVLSLESQEQAPPAGIALPSTGQGSSEGSSRLLVLLAMVCGVVAGFVGAWALRERRRTP